MLITSDNKTHQATVSDSEMTRQADCAKAKTAHDAGETCFAEFDDATRAATIAHHRRCLVSATEHGLHAGVWRDALRDLGATA